MPNSRAMVWNRLRLTGGPGQSRQLDYSTMIRRLDNVVEASRLRNDRSIPSLIAFQPLSFGCSNRTNRTSRESFAIARQTFSRTRSVINSTANRKETAAWYHCDTIPLQRPAADGE